MDEQEATQRLAHDPSDRAAADVATARILRGDQEGFYKELQAKAPLHPAARAPAVVAACKSPLANYSGEIAICAKRIEKPRTIAQLQNLVATAAASKTRMRALATRHSFSDILDTDGTVIDVTELLATPTGMLPREDELWREPWPQATLVRVAASAKIKTLRENLKTAGLGFENLGGFAGQTLIGAISTSTHGSGLRLPPLPDIVHSLDLLTVDGFYRIEPANGPTDIDKFNARPPHPGMKIEQNDDTFRSVLVSLGCMGIVTSALIEVTGHYLLHQTRKGSSWTVVKNKLDSGILNQYRHVEVLVHPYQQGQDHACMLTTREVPLPSDGAGGLHLYGDHPDLKPDGRKFLETLTNGWVGEQLGKIMAQHPRLRDAALLAAINLEGEPPQLTLDAEDLFDIGPPNDAPVSSAEYCVPVAQAGAAMDALLAVVKANEAAGLIQTSPLALRFVAPSNAYMSMMHDRATCTVEAPILITTPRYSEVLLSYERALMAPPYGARPHWGQVNTQPTGPWWKQNYAKSKEWLDTLVRFNASGTFDNHFTDRLGISKAQRP